MTPCRTWSTASERVWTTMPSVHSEVHDAGVPLTPSISTTHSRQEPNALSESVAHRRGTSTPASLAARSTDVPAGTVIERPSMLTVALDGDVTAGVP